LGYSKEGITATEALEPLAPAEDAIGYLSRFGDKEKMLLAGHLPSLGKIASTGDLRWVLTPTQLRLLVEGK
jgi:phosphohistidine phosphatase SixA